MTSLGRWVVRALSALVGGLLGAAIGHGIAWLSVTPLPDDAAARALAEQFAPGQAGTIERDDRAWTFEPSGWRGVLLGYHEARPGQVTLTFPGSADSSFLQRTHLEAVADDLRQSSWGWVKLDESYPNLWAADGTFQVRYGPYSDPDADGDGAAIRGARIQVFRDTPAAAPVGLLIGATVGAAMAALAAVAMQRVMRHRPPTFRRVPLVLVGAAAVFALPGSLATLGALYLYLVDDLPQDPLWVAYSLPLTRLPALLAALLVTSAAALLVARPRATTSGAVNGPGGSGITGSRVAA